MKMNKGFQLQGASSSDPHQLGPWTLLGFCRQVLVIGSRSVLPHSPPPRQILDPSLDLNLEAFKMKMDHQLSRLTNFSKLTVNITLEVILERL